MTKNLTHETLTPEFLSRYPGPYCCQAGHDCVDETFDIFCLESDQHIAATYYWSERRACELVAHVICQALNALHVEGDGHALFADKQVTECEVQMFCGMHRPLFKTRTTDCDFRGPGMGVFSIVDERHVITIYGSDAVLIADQIAASLNEFFRVHLLRSQSLQSQVGPS